MYSVLPAIRSNSLLVSSREQGNQELEALVGKVKNCFYEFQKNPSRELRTTYFKALSELHQFAKFPLVQVFDKDTYIREAESVGETFQAYPDSISRLVLPAAKYITELELLERELSLPAGNSNQVLVRLKRTAAAHQSFVRAFVPEFKMATRHLVQTTPMNFPKTIQLFQSAYKEEVNYVSPELVLLLPKLALCKLISNPNQEIPELVQDQEETIEYIRSQFRDLSFEDQNKLLDKLKGKELNLSQEASELFHEIILLASMIHRREAVIFNNIAQVFFNEK